MKLLDLAALDEIETARIEQYARLNNVSVEQAAELLIKQSLNEWVDSIVVDEETKGPVH